VPNLRALATGSVTPKDAIEALTPQTQRAGTKRGQSPRTSENDSQEQMAAAPTPTSPQSAGTVPATAAPRHGLSRWPIVPNRRALTTGSVTPKGAIEVLRPQTPRAGTKRGQSTRT
jgi:hypothetical protein